MAEKREKVRASDLQQQRRNSDERGLVCRVCGCRHFEVVYTQKLEDGRIRRRRQCRHCGHRITTHETQI